MSTRLQIMGSRIRTARQFRRLTGEQLAEKIGIAVDSLRHIENGVRSPSFQLIERISDILDVSLDYLAGKTDSFNHLICTHLIRLYQICTEG